MGKMQATSSISSDKNISTYLIVKPVPMKSLPWSATFPFIGEIFQSLSLFVTNGAVLDESFDVVVH